MAGGRGVATGGWRVGGRTGSADGGGGGGGLGQRLAVVPGHPTAGLRGGFRGVALELGEIVEGIEPAEFTRVDEAHEDVPDVGTARRLVEEGVPPVADRFFQRPFAEVVVQ